MILKFLWLINPQKIINIIHFNSPDFKDDSAWWWPLMINNPESRVKLNF
jgi:hypothetical protein